MNIIDKIESEQLKPTDKVGDFNVGDQVKVHTRVTEGNKERIQIFAGIVLGKRGTGVGASFTVRKISYGEGVERVFQVHSPRIDHIEVTQKGKVRRAKLHFLRDRVGKKATLVKAAAKQPGQKGAVAVPTEGTADIPDEVELAPTPEAEKTEEVPKTDATEAPEAAEAAESKE